MSYASAWLIIIGKEGEYGLIVSKNPGTKWLYIIIYFYFIESFSLDNHVWQYIIMYDHILSRVTVNNK